MFGSDYLVGYSQGRSSAEDERDTNALVARVFTGIALCKSINPTSINFIDCSRNSARNSIHNFDKGEQFYAEALDWKEERDAPRGGCESSARLTTQRFRPNSPSATPPSDQAQAAIARERAAHQTTHEEKWGLNLFRLMATWLINAHIAGRSDRPEFAEMRDMAKDVTDAIERGEPFRGYRDEPEKKARLQALLEELLRP